MHDMEKEGKQAKKSSLTALHKLMKDLHHKSMGTSPKEEPHSSVEIDIMHSPLTDSEHDEENKGPGVNPFDDRDMEGDQAAELADHSHEVEESEEHPSEMSDEDDSEKDDHSDMKLPAGLHEMLKKHLKK
jgi:hypothetical protein